MILLLELQYVWSLHEVDFWGVQERKWLQAFGPLDMIAIHKLDKVDQNDADANSPGITG